MRWVADCADSASVSDPAATNFGGPLPCTYLPPAESYVRVVRTVPNKDGAIFKPQEEGRGLRLGGVWCLPGRHGRGGPVWRHNHYHHMSFIDGTTPYPFVLVAWHQGRAGKRTSFWRESEFNPEAMQTKYIISYLKRIHNSGQGQTEWEIATSVFPLIVNWRVP